jgi:YHS domain-containing protein
MIRNLLVLFIVLVIYYAVRTVIRSASKAYHEEDDARARLKGDDLVLDPQCRTYVVKDRALTRNIRGKLCSFCSEACARKYEEKNRD